MGYQPHPKVYGPVVDPKPGMRVWIKATHIQGELIAPRRFDVWVVRAPAYGGVYDLSYSLDRLGVDATPPSTPPGKD